MAPPPPPAPLHPISAQVLGVADNGNPTNTTGVGLLNVLRRRPAAGCWRARVQLFEDISWDGDAVCGANLAERFLARVVGAKSNIIAHARFWSQSVLLVCVIRRSIRRDLGHSEVGLSGISLSEGPATATTNAVTQR
jgi:hypothetical protein